MVRRGDDVFIMIDTNPKRDDIVRPFDNLARALREAGMAVVEHARNSNRKVEDRMDGPRDLQMRTEGWEFFTEIGEEGRSVSVIRARLE